MENDDEAKLFFKIRDFGLMNKLLKNLNCNLLNYSRVALIRTFSEARISIRNILLNNEKITNLDGDLI
ncbi:hypothetical protein BpHYR1_025979 [Brachionus plicatilis]|uniref:Uncharacterized protein n=1 Tax=Brachionus plicatilis TaxID=10195 RepID=A0A3M7P8G0_BRAPC|nr:hypothetical protein BpHYR1_025979 [Brachionus plicatilis]